MLKPDPLDATTGTTEMTDELTERVARAIHRCRNDDSLKFEDLHKLSQEAFRNEARAAIEAYEAAPQPAPAVERWLADPDVKEALHRDPQKP